MSEWFCVNHRTEKWFNNHYRNNNVNSQNPLVGCLWKTSHENGMYVECFTYLVKVLADFFNTASRLSVSLLKVKK